MMIPPHFAPALRPAFGGAAARRGRFEKMKDVDPYCCVCFIIITIVLFFLHDHSSNNDDAKKIHDDDDHTNTDTAAS
jgi:hypothetical protein